MKSLSKVKLRQKKLKNGEVSLYLDFYPAVYDYKKGKTTRRHFLKMYIKDKPKSQAERQAKKEILTRGEAIRSQVQMELYKGTFKLNGDNQKSVDFLAYFKSFVDSYKAKNQNTFATWNAAYNHLYHHIGGQLMMEEVTKEMVEGFKEYLLTASSLFSVNPRGLSQNSKNLYFKKFRTVVRKAYEDKKLKENPTVNVLPIKTEDTKRQYLTVNELVQFANTDFKDEDFKAACLFAVASGMRHCDIKQLKWSDIKHNENLNQYTIHYRQKKTKNIEQLPISIEAIERLGIFKNTDELIFPKLQNVSSCSRKLAPYIKKAGIDKHITFHCFRHTYATLLLNGAVDIFTVSKLLGHRSVKTTQIYAKLTDKSKMEAIKALPSF